MTTGRWAQAIQRGMPADAVLLIVNEAAQDLQVVRQGRVEERYPVSTATAGLGEIENSFKTPRGYHRVCEWYGQGLVAGSVFVSRVFTGEVLDSARWRDQTPGSDLILSRIMRLEGMEDGFNRGGCVDTYQRMIYIHGTNQEHWVGRAPSSHGCIRMLNQDVVSLFDALHGKEVWVFIG